MTTWSRVTLVGERRRVDAVLPAEEPIGSLMPELLRLLGDPVRTPAVPLHLTTAAGDFLDGGSTLADKDIADGAVLRVVRADDPLPAPVVHEVPEAVGAALDDHAGRWGSAAARWTATAVSIALCLAVGAVVWSVTGDRTGVIALAAIALLLAGAGAALGPFWREPLGTALSIGGGAVAALAVWHAADLYTWPGWARWCGLAVVAALLVIGLGLTSRLGRGGLVGGGVALALALLWAGAAVFGLGFARSSILGAVACVVLLGLILRLALTFSGLTMLDDRRSEGSVVASADVRSALANAHTGMVVSTAAVALSAAVAGFGLTTDLDAWTTTLTVLLAVVVGSRSRMFPLVTQKVPLVGATVAIVVAFAAALPGHAPWGAAAAVGLLVASLGVPLVVLTTDPPAHMRARLRRVTDRIEAVAIVVFIPVAIGALGTYERLLATF
ncbi:type VII secretion integral membrane protein EccD [Nocardiopsis mwathae]|uniref:Type VII secretion integral membrane protein EccD n=1 Tax=Nocardiopsis mwathae TaxID=1472723 RepID=A0A7W9YKS7_9ACTN|nr:type VII secretion integral membrane protein EccD [Nocardiopsis mwathae]MBB6173857.1 type VII secretion integral membrane protein EccD [Nocardiopsis mwathae]